MDMGAKKPKILEGMIIANCQQCIFVRDWKPLSPALLLDGYFTCTVTVLLLRLHCYSTPSSGSPSIAHSPRPCPQHLRRLL